MARDGDTTVRTRTATNSRTVSAANRPCSSTKFVWTAMNIAELGHCQVLLQVLEQFCPKEESRLDFFPLGDEAAREFADWLSEASSSAHQQLASASSRPSPSPRALSTSSPAGPTFFGSPNLQRRQQLQTLLGRARQEVSPAGPSAS